MPTFLLDFVTFYIVNELETSNSLICFFVALHIIRLPKQNNSLSSTLKFQN